MKKAAKMQKKLKKNKKISAKEKKETQDHKCDNEVKDPEIADDIDSAETINDEEMSEKKTKDKPERKIIPWSKAEQRTEPSQTISEFHLTEIGKEKVKFDDLIKATKKIKSKSVQQQLQKIKKLKSLSVPLSRPQQEKIKRSIAYEKVCNEVAKWDPIVKSNRDADQIIYPLKKPELLLESFETTSERFVSKHPVEEAVSKILQTSENVLDNTKTLTEAEEKALQAMSIEEAKLRHSELMKHRALLSYKETKARRQNKIKSKRYHRILKREKLKKMMKEFEELQKTDEKAALEKFLEADKLRILERMTLKHRNTGKWAKQQKIRAKYNPESRDNLKEDLAIGKQLREKISVQLPGEPNKESEVDPEDKFFEDPSDDKFLTEGIPFENGSSKETISNIHNFISSQILDVYQNGDTSKADGEWKTVKSSKSKPVKISTVEDEMAFSSEATCLDSLIPDDITFGDEDVDDGEEGKIPIEQAFADDECIAEFQEEKKAADRANQPKGINLFLPGWGSWGGPGIKNSKRKKRRFLIKPLEPQPKKNTLGNVIINEDKDKKAAEHQVSHLPFPFSNVHQFNSYIRQPIGPTWNPQSSFQNIVAPKTITKAGKIINPIDSEDVVLEKKNVTLNKKFKPSEGLKPF